MKYWMTSWCLLTASFLYGQEDVEPIPHEVIERQLASAEAEFKKAKEMFNPWYTGPLLTPSSNVVPAGSYNIQPYLFVTDNYAKFDEHGKAHSIPDLLSIKGLVVFQFGILSWMNGVFTPQFIRNSQSGHCAARFGDTSLGLNMQLYKETTYYPGVLFGISESFPSGKYQKLNPKKGGIDGVGAGAFLTTFSLTVGKVIWWWFPKHPMRFRFSLNYTVPSRVEVHDFNTYGGGFGTKGKVHPGGTFAGDIGYEFSFDQHWVFALDAVYTYTSKTTFSGRLGESAPGVPNAVGGPFNDNLSFAPAIEYNVNANFGFIAGVWFSPWGRNSTKFVSGVFSFEYTW